MAKLKKRPDGRYQVSVYIGRDEHGKRRYKSVYGKTQKEVCVCTPLLILRINILFSFLRGRIRQPQPALRRRG